MEGGRRKRGGERKREGGRKHEWDTRAHLKLQAADWGEEAYLRADSRLHAARTGQDAVRQERDPVRETRRVVSSFQSSSEDPQGREGFQDPSRGPSGQSRFHKDTKPFTFSLSFSPEGEQHVTAPKT